MRREKMLGRQAELGACFCRHCGYLAIAIFNVKDKHDPLITCDFAQSAAKILIIS
jgi:hypothetical protein